MDKGNIIFLNGVSSAGKTTLSKTLQDKLSVTYYHICCDDFMNMSPKQKMRDDFGKQLLITQGIMHETISLFCDKGHNVIVDDVVLDLPDCNDWLFEYVTMFQGYPVLFVRVDCPMPELQRREVERGDRHIGQAIWQTEHMDYSVVYDLVVNTHHNTTEECAGEIIHMLNKKDQWIAFKKIKEKFDKERCVIG